jgi:hypothetical protein
MVLGDKDVLYENGVFWVLDAKNSYHVIKTDVPRSYFDSEHTSLSLARERCDHLARLANNRKPR